MQEGRSQPLHALSPSQVTEQNTVKDALGRGVEAECKCTGSTGDVKVRLRGSSLKHHEKFCLGKFGLLLWAGLGDKRQKYIENGVLPFMGKKTDFFFRSFIFLFPSCVNLAKSLGLFLLNCTVFLPSVVDLLLSALA